MNDIVFQKILSSIAGILMIMQSMLPGQPVTPSVAQPTTLGSYNWSGGSTYRLKTSAGLSDSTIYLSSFKEPVSNIKYTMTVLNTTVAYGTLDPQTNQSEFISFTGITQNADGSANLTGVTRGLARSFPYTASTTLRQSHAGQSIFILSDSPQHFNEFAVKKNYETITGGWTFATAASSSVECTATTEYCTKGYIDGLSIQGAATSSESTLGIVRLSTNTEIVAGTASSTSGAPLVLPTRQASSTFNGLYNNVLPVTKTNGGQQNTIDPNFIATSSAYIFSTTTNYNLTTGTLVATSTLNGYTLPLKGHASSTVLMENGSGVLDFLPESWSLLARQTFGVAATNTISFSPRNQLKVFIRSQGDTSNGDGKTLNFNDYSKDPAAIYGVNAYEDTTLKTKSCCTLIGNPNLSGTTTPFTMMIDINNATATKKIATYTGTMDSGNFPYNISGSFIWATTTTQINSISLTAYRWTDIPVTGYNWTTGMTIEVYGSNTP